MHIQKVYETTRFKIQIDTWQQLHPRHFVNVLLIHHSEQSIAKEFFYVATVMKHGLALNQSGLLTNKNNNDALVGEYFQVKSKGSLTSTKPNAISDIFKSFENDDGSTKTPTYILIQGAPGIGKTTLCKEVAYQWATNSILKETELLFLMYLHDPSIINIKCLKDLVHYQYSFVEEDTELSEQCAKILAHRNGIGLTILFDGYDEYNSSNDSIITKILNRKVLPHSRIVVTSRLTASFRLHSLADVIVEVLGFTDESKSQYIKQELMGHPNKINELHSYLNTHAAIKSICYMPMMMTILVCMFKEKGYLPNNSTELYNKFIAHTMCHHLQKHNISDNDFVTLQNFPIEYKSVLTDLSKFAFLTLQNKQKIFSREDINNLCPNSLLASFNLEGFGIINSVRYRSIDKGESHAFSFLHLSIHEYLAAYHLSSVDQCDQFKELENTFLNEMYQETWNMFVSMNKDTWLNVQNYSIYCKDAYGESLSQWISNIKSSFLKSFAELYNILNCNAISGKVVQVLFHENNQCSSNAINVDAHYKQMYISLCDQKNVHKTKLQLFVINNKLNLNWYKLLKDLYKFSMVFCENYVLILSKANIAQIVNFFKCNISLIYIVLIDCHIAKNTIDAIKLSCLQNLQNLQISRCTIECDAFVKLTIFLSSLSTLFSITVNQGSKWSAEWTKVVCSVIMTNCNLKMLNLSNNQLQNEVIEVAKSLKHTRTLEVLNLSESNISESAATAISDIITSNTSLRALYICNNNLGSSIVTILKCLSKISFLEVLDLRDNQISEEAVESIASVVLHNPRLKELYLSSNNFGIGILKVTKSLQHITTLKELNLSNNNIPQEACCELALAIKLNQQLEKLWLNDSNLHSSAIIILDSLATLTTLTVLSFNNNQIPQEAGEALASVILHNARLEELYLDSNNLGIGTVKVAKSLQHITALKVLSLDNNNIPQEASEELGLAIKSNENLEKLWLNDNNLCSSAIVILNSLATITTLTVLELNNNQIPQEAGGALAAVIMHNTRLEELYLDNNTLDIGILEVAKSLQHITTLKILSLYNNNIPREACNELALAIKSNIYLRQLYLNNNCFHLSLVLMLQASQFLSNLNIISIYGNTVTEEAGNLLASVIMKNTEVEALGLNLLIAPLKIAEVLQILSGLQVLMFCTCKMSEQIEIMLAYVITKNKSLTGLSLPNIKLSQHVTLQAIATLSNLTTLWLEDNLLSEQMSDDLSLAISSNKSLEILVLLDNNLQTGLIEIVKACIKLGNIEVLQIAHNHITSGKVIELTSIITQITSLERVLLGGMTLNAAECFHFNISEVLHKIEVPSYCSNTTSIISSYDYCTSLEVIYLEMLRKQIDNAKKCVNDICTYVDRKNFNFSEKICQYFEHTNITKFTSQQVKRKLEQINAKKMISSLCMLGKVKVIDLENNNIDEDASFELATALHSNNVLEQLWLRGNKLNIAGALYILNSLEYLTTLQVLDLSYNNIGSESANGIAAVIDNNPLINQLWLDGNDLYSTGTIVICNALKKIRTLSILSLCNNGITDDAADELSAVITHNVLLEDLLLSNNQLQYTGITKIGESLSKLIKLLKLDLFNNDISRRGASLLAAVLQNSTSLQDLFLSGNNLETSGALEICNTLSHINSLHVLTLSNNNISDEITSQLIEVLNNNHLYALLIGGNGLECGALKIAQVIEIDNIAMQLLDFSNNNISEQDKEKIKIVFSKRVNFLFYV